MAIIRWIQNRKTIDLICFLFVSIGGLVFSLALSSQAHPLSILEQNIWFGSATPRVLQNLDPAVLMCQRVHLHPLFSIIHLPLTSLLTFLGFEMVSIGRFIIALSGSIVSATLFATLRLNKLSTFSSFLGCCMFLCSGVYFFWWSVIESFPIGGAAISIVFLLISAKVNSAIAWILATPFTLGITVTNWLVCILGVFQTFSKRKAIKILFSGLILTGVLYGIQKIHFHNPNPNEIPSDTVNSNDSLDFDSLIKKNDSGGLFLSLQQLVKNELQYSIYPENREDTPLVLKKYFQRFALFFCSPAAAAKMKLGSENINGYMGIEYGFFAYSVFGWVALICWFVLLSQGLIQIVSTQSSEKLTKVLLGFLVFQFFLHLFYGDNPFLYSAHYVTSLVIVASYSFQGKKSHVFQGVALVYCVSAFISNLETYREAIHMLYNLHG